MVSPAITVLLWNTIRFLVGISLLSLVMGAEFFIGFNIIEIEVWIANHPFHLLFVTSCLMGLFYSWHIKEAKKKVKPRRETLTNIKLISLTALAVVAVYFFTLHSYDSFLDHLLSIIRNYVSKGGVNIIQLLSICAFLFIDFRFLEKLEAHWQNNILMKLFIIILSAVVSTLSMQWLFPIFLKLAVCFFVHYICYAFWLVGHGKLKVFLSALILSLIMVEASRHQMQYELSFIVLSGFVLAQYLLRPKTKC